MDRLEINPLPSQEREWICDVQVNYYPKIL